MSSDMIYQSIDAFLGLCETENTKRSYRQDLKNLSECKITGWKTHGDLIDRYMRLMRSQGYSESTINRRIAVARLYFLFETYSGDRGVSFLSDSLADLMRRDVYKRDTVIFLLMVCFQVPLHGLVVAGDGIRGDGRLVVGGNVIALPSLFASVASVCRERFGACLVSLDAMHQGVPLDEKAIMRVIGRMMRVIGVDITAKKLKLIASASFGVTGYRQRVIIKKALVEKISEQELEECVRNARVIERAITGTKNWKG